jgi:hypothetical protein
MAIAMDWVSRVTTIVLEMVLPGLGGQWLDAEFGFGFFGLLGFAFGVSLGVWHLVLMSQPRSHPARRLGGGSGPGSSVGGDSGDGDSGGVGSGSEKSGGEKSGGAVNGSGVGSGG